MTTPALAKPAHTTSERNEITIRELRCRRQLAYDEPRILDRLDELFAAHNTAPTDDTVAALLKAAKHLKINPAHPKHTTVVRTLQTLTGKPVVLVCGGCGHRVISQLAGRVTCLSCARYMTQRAPVEPSA